MAYSLNMKGISKNRQAGVSLISLMIGLFISMVCILASLTLYKNLINVSVDAKSDTLHDGQLAAAFLTIQLELQSAGYRMPDDGGVDVVTQAVAGSSKLELYWRYSESGFQCRGLVESEVTEGGITHRVLNLVQATDCDENSALVGRNWSTVVATLGRWPLRDGLDTYVGGRESMLGVTIEPLACSPYGAGIPDEHLVVTISAPSSSMVHGAVGGTMTEVKYCLLNT